MTLDRYFPALTKSKKEGDVPSLEVLQEELRKVWAAIHTLTGRYGEIPILSSMAITGDTTTSGIFNGTAVFGSWAQKTNIAGTGLYVWDTERYKNTTFFTRTNSEAVIRLEVAASYLLIAIVFAQADGAGELRSDLLHNVQTVCRARYIDMPAGTWRTLPMAGVITAESGDTISVSLDVGDARLGESNAAVDNSILVVAKLN